MGGLKKKAKKIRGGQGLETHLCLEPLGLDLGMIFIKIYITY